MGRKPKVGLEYFPLDCDLEESDERMRCLVDIYGQTPYTMLVKLFSRIYWTRGYFTPWTDKNLIAYANRMQVDHAMAVKVFGELIAEEFFSKSLYESHGILTSNGIQRQFLDNVYRRQSIEIIVDFWLYPVPPDFKGIDKIVLMTAEDTRIAPDAQMLTDSRFKWIYASPNERKLASRRINVDNGNIPPQQSSASGINANINSKNDDISTQREREREIDIRERALARASELPASAQFDENDFVCYVLPLWKSGQFGNVFKPHEQSLLRDYWRAYGTSKLIPAVDRYLIAKLRDMDLIRRHLDPGDPFTFEYKSQYQSKGNRLNNRPSALSAVADPDYHNQEGAAI